MSLARRQQGMGFFGFMFVLILIGFVAIVVIKLAPVYMENFSVRQVLTGFRNDPGTYETAEGVRDALSKRFNINDIANVKADDVVIEPAPGGYALRADYEVKVPFIANISFLVSFSERGEAHGVSAQ